ncbi:peptidase U35 [Methylobacterium sp. Leaf104]|uniref:HK97 family phage prohead protease n=1 Tax=Methylobacterium TaxID=407 RepID=UPI0006F65BF8|nr:MULTISPECIES: HK97 family phage prohead protease [Methylobacterium]KQP38252.1 peptidase U35 [Methylobacterium sp. Leaf104]MCI9880364.1 HK97 family phage prohead protease [Methylobacterium goesingense]
MDGHFSGYASLFGVPDLGRDVVAPGAFAASLAARGVAGVRMLWQHDPAEPVGRWLSLREDTRGLRVAGQLNLAVRRARELDALLGEGGLDGLSIGFRTVRAQPQRGGLRRLEAIDLWEISLVTFPLQTGARIAAPAQAGAQAPAAASPAGTALAQDIRALAHRMAPPRRAASPSTRPGFRPAAIRPARSARFA